MEKHHDVVLTGGLGFIAKNFAALEAHRFSGKLIIDKITYASDLEYYYNELRPLGWKLIVGDTNNFSTIMSTADISKSAVIINFAAESHVDNSFTNANKFVDSNIGGTLGVLDYCRKYEHKLLHISTDEVYGEIVGTGVTEEANLNPTNPYAATKAAADVLVQTYIRCFNVDAKIVRANNIYGSRQYFEKVIPKAIYCASNSQEFYIHGNKNLRRHFLHASDFSGALMTILENWDTSIHRIFNIGANDVISIRDLVLNIYKFCNAKESLVTVGVDRPFNDAEYLVEDGRIRSLGWQPQIDFWSSISGMCDRGDFFCGL